MREPARGFTLIELLVVMSIIALLLTLALPRYFAQLDKSKESVLKEDLRVMRSCIERYQADKGHYPDTLDELVQSKYLKAVPVDPITDSTQTWKVIQDEDSDTHGVVDVHSGASGKGPDGLTYAEL